MKKFSIRRICQLCSAVFLNGYLKGFQNGSIYTGKTKGICVPVLNCYSCPGALGACPIGTLQTSGAGSFSFPFYVLGFLMLVGIVFGRLACGFFCPFGLVQDLLYKLPGRKWKVKEKLDRKARYIKYVILGLVVLALPVLSLWKNGYGIPYFCKYICPAGTLEGGVIHFLVNEGIRGIVGGMFWWKIGLLILILVLSIKISRPFCKYICPLGAFYGIFQKFSFYRKTLEREKCVDCGQCVVHCPMGIDIRKNTNNAECIQCGKCKRVCKAKAIRN